MNGLPLSLTRTLFGFLLAVVLCAVGCGGGSGKGRIHGKVTLDEQPVTEGSIDFLPVDGKTPTASGIIKDGAYTAEVPYGSKRVVIKAPKEVGKQPRAAEGPDSTGERPIYKESIPAQYNTQSQLIREITASSSEIDFPLKTKE
jgi:hypothetical protein